MAEFHIFVPPNQAGEAVHSPEADATTLKIVDGLVRTP